MQTRHLYIFFFTFISCTNLYSMERQTTELLMPEGLTFPIKELWLKIIAQSCCKWKLRETCKYFRDFASIANDEIFLQNPLVIEQDLLRRCALYYAELNDDAIICNLLSQSLDPNLTDKHAESLLNYAFINQNTIMINALSNHPNLTPKAFQHAFSCALKYGPLKIAQEMLTIKTVDTLKHIYGKYILDKNVDLLTHILSLTNDDKTLSQLLVYAVSANQTKIVRILLNNKANINSMNDYGQPLLHIAINHLPMLKLLLECGADINVMDGARSTPLEYAISRCKLSAVQFLLNHGAQLNTQKSWLTKAIGSLVGKELKELTKILLSKGININARNENNNTALSIAACYRRNEIIPLLLAHPDINVNPINDRDLTPLDIAITQLYENTGCYNCSAKVSAESNFYCTRCNRKSSASDYNDMVLLLIQHGAKTSYDLQKIDG